MGEAVRRFSDFWRGLFIGGDDAASMGKTAFWILFVPAVIYWCRGVDIQRTHETALMFVMGYVLLGKVAGSATRAALFSRGDRDDEPRA